MSFAPVYGPRSRALILGTWPSPKSREMAFYYGHPQNRFWPMLAALTGEPVPAREDIDAKKQLILRHGLALWDTLEILPPCWLRLPLRRCSATGPRHTKFTANIYNPSVALPPSSCPAPAPPTRPAARRSFGKYGVPP